MKIQQLPAIERDNPSTNDPVESAARVVDRWFAGVCSSLTGEIPLNRFAMALMDVALHMARAPGHRAKLAASAMHDWCGVVRFAATRVMPVLPRTQPPIAPDHRFDGEDWQRWPYAEVAQAFLWGEHWTYQAVNQVAGVAPHDRQLARFMASQVLTPLAPCNGALANPVVARAVIETGGTCLIDGLTHFAEDVRRDRAGLPPVGAERFRVGKEVATAPGRVIYRNALMELIQYDPQTELVHPEPVLIVPAWIMKYYILDLSPHNSMVRWLTSQGFTVFMISWHNPGADDADTGLEDYLRMGPRAALDAITALTGDAKIHTAGYCLGGTLLAIEAAAMARDGDARLASVSLFTAQTDFSEPGEIGVFIDEDQVASLDVAMARNGYLSSAQMAAAFKALRAQELVWDYGVHTYLLGDRAALGDLMAWNADGTRMPSTMHSEYLHQLFLGNALAQGRFAVEGRPVTLSALTVPLFAVGTEKDHVAPWHSVFKIHRLTVAELTFVLASGGHNAGIVSEPGHPHRRYRTSARAAGAPAPDPEAWLDQAESCDGSWWTLWGHWLADRSGVPVPPPAPGPSLAPAPGTYVLER